jgi:hypothetical protein
VPATIDVFVAGIITFLGGCGRRDDNCGMDEILAHLPACLGARAASRRLRRCSRRPGELTRLATAWDRLSSCTPRSAARLSHGRQPRSVPRIWHDTESRRGLRLSAVEGDLALGAAQR